jgi:hypothetical protein
VAATTGLAQAGTDTTANPLLVRTGSVSWMQIIETHRLFSLYPYQVRDFVDHATYGRCVFNFHGVTDAAQPETAHTGLVAFQPTAAAFNLGYFDLVSHR